MNTQITPGWYPDPAGEADQRWWDGRQWTERTQEGAVADLDATRARPPVDAPVAATSSAPAQRAPVAWPGMPPAVATAPPPAAETMVGPAPKRGRTTAIVVVSLLVLFAGGAGGAVLLSQSGDEPELEIATARPTAAEDIGGDDPVVDDPDEVLEPDVEISSEGGSVAADDATSDLAGGTTRTVQLDGECTAEVPSGIAVDTLRAWDLEACEFAPLTPEPGGSWIVVLTSLNGSDFDAADARERAREVGRAGQVLWSSHYASLNPNLWVVYDGPYSSEASADAAAPSGSYARVLSDDASDRYCMAADGCAGERARDQ
jgi:hypothetical protein